MSQTPQDREIDEFHDANDVTPSNQNPEGEAANPSDAENDEWESIGSDGEAAQDGEHDPSESEPEGSSDEEGDLSESEEEEPSEECEVPSEHQGREICKEGCEHYRRKCRLKAPCCGKLFTCRFCHDETSDHEIDRYSVKEIECVACGHLQQPQASCEKCGTEFALYFCPKCNLFDDDHTKSIFHCDKCGMCRRGPSEVFFHCDVCGICMHVSMRGNHKCIEKAAHSNCPCCLEYLLSSVKPVIFLPCGHNMHEHCMKSMLKSRIIGCPLCHKAMIDLTHYNAFMDEQVAATIMPPEYADWKVRILCHECHERSEVPFHIVGHKCQKCGSYNTAKD